MRLYHTETIRYKPATRPSPEQLVAALRRMAELLEESLQCELERSPTKDPTASDYPILALDLGKRLANIRCTIAALEPQAYGRTKQHELEREQEPPLAGI